MYMLRELSINAVVSCKAAAEVVEAVVLPRRGDAASAAAGGGAAAVVEGVLVEAFEERGGEPFGMIGDDIVRSLCSVYV